MQGLSLVVVCFKTSDVVLNDTSCIIAYPSLEILDTLHWNQTEKCIYMIYIVAVNSLLLQIDRQEYFL